jgi:hypothetical protein
MVSTMDLVYNKTRSWLGLMTAILMRVLSCTIYRLKINILG